MIRAGFYSYMDDSHVSIHIVFYFVVNCISGSAPKPKNPACVASASEFVSSALSDAQVIHHMNMFILSGFF